MSAGAVSPQAADTASASSSYLHSSTAASDSHTNVDVPSPLLTLLRSVSLELKAAESGLIQSLQHKAEVQMQIQQHARKQREMLAAGSDALPPPTPSAASASSAPASASNGSSFLFRQLSEAAAAGVISREFKDSLKRQLMNTRLSSSPDPSSDSLEPVRLVRHVTDEGEVTVVQEKVDVSGIDPAECATQQEEEREAIKAIYEDVAIGSHTVPSAAAAAAARAKELEAEMANPKKKRGKAKTSPDSASAASASAASSSPAAASAASSSSSSFAPSAAIPSPNDLTIRVLPYPASGPERNRVSVTLTFHTPPLYPYMRPSFSIIGFDGEMTAADSMMIGTAMGEVLNKLYAQEPLDESSVRVCLFDCIQAAESFLQDYIDFLENTAIQAAAAAARKKAEDKAREEEARNAALYAHAQQVLKYMNADAELVDENMRRKQLINERLRMISLGYRAPAPPQNYADEEFKDGYAWEPGVKERLEAEFEEKMADIVDEVFKSICPSPADLLRHIDEFDDGYSMRRASHASLVAGMRDGSIKCRFIASPFLIFRFMRQRHLYTSQGFGKVDIAFHGTAREHLNSIEQNGFLMPGQQTPDGRTIGVRSGQLYGAGIYVSPSVDFALGYGELRSTFTCLVLRGRPVTVGYCPGASCQSGYHSHEVGSQWVLFNNENVLPLYLFEH